MSWQKIIWSKKSWFLTFWNLIGKVLFWDHRHLHNIWMATATGEAHSFVELHQTWKLQIDLILVSLIYQEGSMSFALAPGKYWWQQSVNTFYLRAKPFDLIQYQTHWYHNQKSWFSCWPRCEWWRACATVAVITHPEGQIHMRQGRLWKYFLAIIYYTSHHHTSYIKNDSKNNLIKDWGNWLIFTYYTS